MIYDQLRKQSLANQQKNTFKAPSPMKKNLRGPSARQIAPVPVFDSPKN